MIRLFQKKQYMLLNATKEELAHPERKQWRDFTSRLHCDHIDDLSHSGGIYHQGHKSLFFQTRIMGFMKNIDSFPIKNNFYCFFIKRLLGQYGN